MIGAGPAGAVSAYLLARRGWRVLLVEKANWPRDKPCGGYLSDAACESLQEIGLAHIIADAQKIDRTVLLHGNQRVDVPMDRAYAIARKDFDAALVHAFVAIGGTFVSGTGARVLAGGNEGHRCAQLEADSSASLRVRARVVLACDGLAGSSVSDEPWSRWTIASDSRIGMAMQVDPNLFHLAPGEIHMHLGGRGYVGAVRHDNDSIHLAAALEPQRMRELGGAAVTIRAILESCGRSFPSRDVKFKGVPTLTRRRAAFGGHRLLAVGDACGYVEPFTGEGIAWAIRSAIEATSLLSNDWSDRLPERWAVLHRDSLGRSQMLCNAVRHVTRRPWLAGATIGMLRAAPSLARLVTEAR